MRPWDLAGAGAGQKLLQCCHLAPCHLACHHQHSEAGGVHSGRTIPYTSKLRTFCCSAGRAPLTIAHYQLAPPQHTDRRSDKSELTSKSNNC